MVRVFVRNQESIPAFLNKIMKNKAAGNVDEWAEKDLGKYKAIVDEYNPNVWEISERRAGREGTKHKRSLLLVVVSG